MSNPHGQSYEMVKKSMMLLVVVVGDIIVLHAGDYIPADIRIVESIIKTDESLELENQFLGLEKKTLSIHQE